MTIPIPNERLLELAGPYYPVGHTIFSSCGGWEATDHQQGDRLEAVVSCRTPLSPTDGGPVCESQSRPGSLRAAERDGEPVDAPRLAELSAVERGGPGVGSRPPAPVGVAAGNDEPDVAARLAEPPSWLHPLTWIRYLVRRRR